MKFFLLLSLFSSIVLAQNYELYIVESKNNSMEVLIDSDFSKEEVDLIKFYLDFGASIPNLGEGSLLFKKFFGNDVSGDTYVSWLKDKVKRINKGNDKDNAYAYLSFTRPAIANIDMFDIYLNSEFFNNPDGKPHLGQASIFIHEAAHRKILEFTHSKCDEIIKIENDQLEAISVDELKKFGKDCAKDLEDAYVYQAIFTLNFLKLDPDVSLNYSGHYFLRGFNSYNRGQRISGKDLREKINIDIYGEDFKNSTIQY